MKLRQHKHRIQTNMLNQLFYGWLVPQYLVPGKAPNLVATFRQTLREEAPKSPVTEVLKEHHEMCQRIEAPKMKYTVVKKSTGEFFAEFDTMEEVNAAIEKAKKAKKAALIFSEAHSV